MNYPPVSKVNREVANFTKKKLTYQYTKIKLKHWSDVSLMECQYTSYFDVTVLTFLVLTIHIFDERTKLIGYKQIMVKSTFWHQIITLTSTIHRGYKICGPKLTSTLFIKILWKLKLWSAVVFVIVLWDCQNAECYCHYCVSLSLWSEQSPTETQQLQQSNNYLF